MVHEGLVVMHLDVRAHRAECCGSYSIEVPFYGVGFVKPSRLVSICVDGLVLFYF